MKIAISIFLSLLIISANALLFIFMFKREVLTTRWPMFFKRRELLTLLIYKAALLFPLTLLFIGEDPEEFMNHRLSGYFYVMSLMAYPVLCLTVIPYKIIRRNYSVLAKVFGIFACIIGVLMCAMTLVALAWSTKGW